MSLVAHRASWIVYLNGIEIPCPEVNVRYGVWQVPEATLNFPPHRLLQRLGAEDRIDVAIFYLDDLIEPEKPTFRLLFEGEILGWSYQNTPYGRMMSFTAIADISIYTQLYFFYMNTVEAAVAFQLDPQTASAPAAANIFYPSSLFYKGLFRVKDADSKGKIIERPYEILENVLKGMTSDIPPEYKTIPAVNFFVPWARKRNFINRFVALPLFEDPSSDPVKGVFPIFKAVQMEQALLAVRDGLASTIGEAGSLFQVIQEIFTKAYSELAMIPTAPVHTVSLDTGVIQSRGAYSSEKTAYPTRLANYFAKPAMYFGIPPMCNLILPSMIKSHSYQENYWKQPTRVYVNDTFIPSFVGENPFTASAMRVGYPPEVNVTVQAALIRQQAMNNATPQTTTTGQPISITARAFRNSKNLLIYPEEFFRGPVLSKMNVPSWFTILQKVTAAQRTKAPTVTGPTPPEAQEAANNLIELFGSYARYEYYRQRYEQRGGSVDMSWNPYVVPGFPCAIFDTRQRGLDTVGYVNAVTQTLSARGAKSGQMTTSIQYMYARTFHEMLRALYDVRQGTVGQDNVGLAFGNAPPDPVGPVSDITQDFAKAEQLYRTLFFGRDAPMLQKQASFDFRNLVGFDPYGDSYGDVKRVTPFVHVPTKSNLNEASDYEIVPLPGTEPIFTQHETAMRFIARPICTLEEYLGFLYPGKTIDELMTETPDYLPGPVLAGADYAYSESPTGANAKWPSAIFWSRIKRFRQGPGPHPGSAATGFSVSQANLIDPNKPAIPTASAPTALPPSNAQTRINWDEILEAYRTEMLKSGAQR